MSGAVPSILRASQASRGPRPSGRPGVGEAPLVSLACVSKSFKNGVVALSRLDLSVHAGEFLSLLGPSGCGKSTALRLIAGLERPSSGRIEWGEVAKGAHDRPSIGFVFQDPTLMPWA